MPRSKVSRRRVKAVCIQYEPLVKAMARFFSPRARALPLGDLVQEGYVALCKAAHDFPMYHGKYRKDFGAYAKARIASHLRDVTIRHGLPMEVPTSAIWKMWRSGELKTSFVRASIPSETYQDFSSHTVVLEAAKGSTETDSARAKDLDRLSCVTPLECRYREQLTADPALARTMFRLYLQGENGHKPLRLPRMWPQPADGRTQAGKVWALEQEFGLPLRIVLRAAFAVFQTTARVREVLGVHEITVHGWVRRYCRTSVRRLRMRHPA